MGSLVLLTALSLLFWIWFLNQNNWREAVILALITLAAIIVIITETLGIFNLITYQYVFYSWLLVNFIFLVILFRKRAFVGIKVENWRKIVLEDAQSLIRTHWVVLGLILAIITIGFNGAAFEPNGYDSLSYHLARILHWLQNRSVDHYPTNTIRQLVMSPGAEFTMLHLMLLGNNDRLAYLPQWFSMVGSMVVATLIAKRLGADRSGQVLAATVALTIPVGILEASGTLNDYVVAFWILCFYYFSISLIMGEQNWVTRFGFSFSLGLAILTKSTAYVYALPAFLWLFVHYLRARQKEILLTVIFAGVVSLLLNLGHFTRNITTFGSFVGSPTETSLYLNELHTPTAVVSNLVRNVSLHLSTPSGSVNLYIVQAVKGLHRLLGMDVNDPRTTFMADTLLFQYGLSTQIRHEVYASNFVHLVLIMLAILVFILKGHEIFDSRNRNFLVAYACTVLGTFLVFSLVLKWQPFHSRQQLPFFLLFSPFIAIILNRTLKWSVNLTGVILLVFSLPWLLFNQSRPMVSTAYLKYLVYSTAGRMHLSSVAQQASLDKQFFYGITCDPHDQLFREVQSLHEPLQDAIGYLEDQSSCTDIGFVPCYDQIEYPVWKMLRERISSDLRIEHVLVKNGSEKATHTYPPFNPCAIISLRREPENSLLIGDNIFNRVFTSSSMDGNSSVSIYTK